MTVGQACRDPVAVGLRAAAGWELLGVFAQGRRAQGERMASSAALFLAAEHPGLRVGALLSATLAHLARAVRLARQRRARRSMAELTTSAMLAGLLHEESRARQWDA
jgi:hypothetical protein